MRTEMHGKSCISSAMSVSDDKQNFKISFSTVAVAQWVGCWNNGHGVVQAEGSSPGAVEIYTNFFSATIFISVLA